MNNNLSFVPLPLGCRRPPGLVFVARRTFHNFLWEHNSLSERKIYENKIIYSAPFLLLRLTLLKFVLLALAKSFAAFASIESKGTKKKFEIKFSSFIFTAQCCKPGSDLDLQSLEVYMRF